MAAGRIIIPNWMPALDSDGAPIPNVSAYIYQPGTTTLATVYSTEDLTVPLANPVQANSSGRFPSIWADTSQEFDVSVDAPFGPPGQPYTFTSIVPSVDANLAAAQIAQGAADAAEAAAEEAQAAADRIEGVAGLVEVAFANTTVLGTRQALANFAIPPVFDTLTTTGYSEDGDGGDALYVRVDSEPAHAGKFQSADGAWWELEASYAALEMFGGKADNTTDNYQAFQDAVYWSYLKGRQVVLTRQGNYRTLRRPAQSSAPVPYPCEIVGANPFVQMTVESGNDAEGMHILASDVTIRGFRLFAAANTGITNGTGHCGTCITTQQWFVDPTLPEPPLVKNVVIRDMYLGRETGTLTGHAIAIMSRTSHVSIENCDFVGAGPSSTTGQHGNAVLTHWGAHTNGVSTTQLSYDAQTANFTAGATLTGGTSGATAYIVEVDDSGATGTIFLKNVVGTFVDNETITDGAGGSATANGAPSTGLRQSPFPPGRYSFHPNNVRIRNVRLRNTGRLIACSSSYSVDVDGVDYLGAVQGGQLVDLPVGDESDTFAHPDDRGRVYDGFSFKNIRGKMLTGTGTNAVTVIDCSGYSTSKQTDANLAAYAGPEYAGEPFNQVVPRYRQPEWKNAVFDGLTWDYGPADPPSATVVQRMVWIRNVWGNFSFRNINGVARDNAIRSGVPDPYIAALTMANNIGNFSFWNCKFDGHAVIDSTDTADFTNCAFKHKAIESGTNCVTLTGAQPTITSNAANSAGDTSISLGAGVTGTNICIGDRLVFAGGVVYCTEFVLGGIGVTTVKTTPFPAAAGSATVFTIDHRNRAMSFTNCNIRRGSRGYDVSNSIGTHIEGGEVFDSGQYGVLIGDGARVVMDDTMFANGGQRRVAGEPGLATRDIILNGGMFQGDGVRFGDSAHVSTNYVVGSGAQSASLQNSVFAGTPITSRVQVSSLTNGQPVTFLNNTDATGAPVTYEAARTPEVDGLPRVYIAGDSRGAQCSDAGRTRTQAWMWHLQQQTAARFDFQPSYNIAVGGYDSEQMLADVGLLLNQPPSIVIAICSTNDRTAGWTADRTITALSAWQQRVTAHGHTVIWIAETPRGSAEDTTYRLSSPQRRGAHLQVRAWQQAQAAKANVYVADPWALLAEANASALDARNGLFYDGLHPGPKAATIIAQAIAPIINTLLPVRPRLVENIGNVWSADNPYGALNPNPVLAGTGGTAGTGAAGTVATSWTASAGAGIAITASKGTNTEGFNYQRMVVSGTPTGTNPGTSPLDPTNFSAMLTAPLTNITAGDVIEATGQFTLAAGATGVRAVSLYVTITTGSGTTRYASGEANAARSVINLEMASDVITNGTLVVPRFTAPSGIVSASISLMVVGAPADGVNPNVPISATIDGTRIAARKVI